MIRALLPKSWELPQAPPSAPPALTHLHLLADLYQLGHLVFQFAVAFNQVGEICLQGLLQVQKWEKEEKYRDQQSWSVPCQQLRPSATKHTA